MKSTTVLHAVYSQGWGWGWAEVPVAPSSHLAVFVPSMLALGWATDTTQSQATTYQSTGIQTPPAPDKKAQNTLLGAPQGRSLWVRTR